MNLEQELAISRRRVYTPCLGKINLSSYNEFTTKEDALAFWWAAAKCQEPFTAMIFMGLDGFQANLHLKDKEIPVSLKDKVQSHIDELDEISLDAAAERNRQHRDWRP